MEILKIKLAQPFKKIFKNIYSWNKKLKTHKAIEFNVYFDTSTLLLLELLYNPKTMDHTGFQFYIGFFGFEIEFNYYDTRHVENYND